MIKKTTLIALLVIMSVAGACGEADDESAPINFKIAWHVKAGQEVIMGPRAIPAGVVTLKATITAEDMVDLVQAYTDLDQTGWSFEIQKVPVGENRAIVMDGLDSGDQIIAQGTIAGFSIIKNESNDIGTIVMRAYANGQTDTTPPDTTITSNTSALSNSTDAALNFNCSEAICTFECRLDSAGWSACVSPVFYGGLADGNYLFEVRATDDSGNVDAYPASVSWTVDTTPPDANIAYTPSALANSPTADFYFSDNEVGSSFECRLDGGSWGACSSPVSYSGLSESSHTFDLRAVDTAGNTDASPASFTWSIDLTSPQTTISGFPVSPTNQITAEFQFDSSESGSTFACRIDSDLSTFCTSPYKYYSLIEGSHTLEVQAIDPSGNIDPSPASYAWTVDRTPPDTAITTKPSNPTSQTTANFEFISNEAGATSECRIDSGTWMVCSSPKVYSSLTAGDHTLRVRSKDPAGNLELTPAVHTWTIDTQAPETNISSYPQNPTNSTLAVFLFDSDDINATFECRLDTGNWGVCLSPRNYSSLSSANHTFNVRAIDLAGNIDPTPASHAWTVDLAAPNTNITSYPSNPTNQVSATFVFTSTETSSTFECKLDTGPFTTCSSPHNYSGLSAGGHTFQVRAIDTAWNPDPTPASYGWTIDTTPPDTSLDSYPSNPTTQTSATFRFSSEAGACFECKLDQGSFTTCVSPKTYSSGLTEGTHYFQVRATDQAGNTNPTPEQYNWAITFPGSWQSTSESGAPSGRYGHTAVWADTEMIIWGGYAGAVTSSGGRYDPSADSWVATTLAGAPSERTGHTAVWAASRMVVWGGENSSSDVINTGGCYYPSPNTWAATNLGSVESQDDFEGGIGPSWTTGGADNWVVDTTSFSHGAQSARCGIIGDNQSSYLEITLNLANPGMVYFGLRVSSEAGSDFLRLLIDGVLQANWSGEISWSEASAAYTSGTHTFRWEYKKDNTVSRGYDWAWVDYIRWVANDPPSPRTSHTAVGTGTGMIVWGGEDLAGGYFDTGSRYVPGADTWSASATFTAVPPSGRYGHTAVWTGTQMIVWGGEGVSGYLNTGARYDPSTDSWAAITLTGVPAARKEHTAVWTASKMVVWGGTGGAGLLNTGGRYDPAADTWMATSTTEAPEARKGHTAVWTGTEMIVWGGENLGGTSLNSGSLYDPSSDTWVATTFNGAPAARKGHTAVWTGTQMIIWGGYAGVVTSTGGRYTP